VNQHSAIGLAAVFLRESLIGLWRDQDALTTVEYCLLLAVLALGTVVAFGGLSSSVSSGVNAATDAVDEAGGPGSGMGCES